HLHRLDHKVEMGLRVTWDVPNIFEYFVQTHSELRAARDRLLGQRHAPTQEDKIEVGRMFEQALSGDREQYTGIVENALSKSCLEFKRNRCRNEQDVMNLACLVDRDGQSGFEPAVLTAAQLFDNNFAFDYNGPWAPYNFANLSLKS
ncbi:MAG: GvpL/GvpF family gas vesicle protein, partial [Acidobacteria bacterium]|nr:GvpL/GvpF family gas vesicle protein [Acidobacteriota bacterium]